MNVFEQIQTIIEANFTAAGNFDETLKRQIASKILKDRGYNYRQIAEGLKQIGTNTSASTLTRDIDRFEGYLMYKNRYPDKIKLYEQVLQALEAQIQAPTLEIIDMENIDTPLETEATAPKEKEKEFASPFADAPVIDRTISKKSSAFDDDEEDEDEDDVLLAGDEQVPEDVPEVKVADAFSYEIPTQDTGTVGGELPAAQVKFTSDSLLDLLTFYTPKALCFFTNINVSQVQNETLTGNMPEDAPTVVKKKNELSKEAYEKVVTEYKPFLQKSILGVVSATKLNIKPEYMFIIHFIGFATQMQNVVREVNKSNSELLESLRKEKR